MRIDFPGVVGTIDVYLDVMRAICGNTEGKSMIDIGCCFAPNTPKLGFKDRLYVDTIARKLDHPEEQKFFVECDALDIPHAFISHQFDVAIASDLIEHLTYMDGRKLIEIMQSISYRQILFTPTTEIFKMVDDDNKDPEAHRSLWHPDHLPDYASIVFPQYHKVWNGGAFFSFHCQPLDFMFRDQKYIYEFTICEFERIVGELKSKPWAK